MSDLSILIFQLRGVPKLLRRMGQGGPCSTAGHNLMRRAERDRAILANR